MPLASIFEPAFKAANNATSGVNVSAVLTEIAQTAANTTSQAGEWAWANPATAAGALLVVAGGTAVVAPAAVAAPALSAAGFGPGIVKASVAATVQSGLGNIVAGSTFATLQSAGAGGYGVAVVSGLVQTGGAGVVSVGAATMAWVMGNTTQASGEGVA